MQIAQKMEINTIKSLFLHLYFMKTTTNYHSKNTNPINSLCKTNYDIVDMKN
jgi:hypothetical protein